EAYLVKPIDEHSLKTTIEVALYNFRHKSEETSTEPETVTDFGQASYFFIKVKSGLQKIELQDVLFFEANDNYSWVYTKDKKHLIALTLKTIENKLPVNQFMRVHRSFIVQMGKIERIDEIALYMGTYKIPIGKTFKSEIMSKINLL
ncbi:MAG: response regulator transcription factor, partial [Bacteroidetes bacterium]|nr:response regulator transcription factor [Bacteroidota bacterium]